MTDKLSYTVQEASRAVGASRSSLYKLIKAGELKAFTWCGRTLIRADELHRHLDQASRNAALN